MKSASQAPNLATAPAVFTYGLGAVSITSPAVFTKDPNVFNPSAAKETEVCNVLVPKAIAFSLFNRLSVTVITLSTALPMIAEL